MRTSLRQYASLLHQSTRTTPRPAMLPEGGVQIVLIHSLDRRQFVLKAEYFFTRQIYPKDHIEPSLWGRKPVRLFIFSR